MALDLGLSKVEAVPPATEAELAGEVESRKEFLVEADEAVAGVVLERIPESASTVDTESLLEGVESEAKLNL